MRGAAVTTTNLPTRRAPRGCEEQKHCADALDLIERRYERDQLQLDPDDQALAELIVTNVPSPRGVTAIVDVEYERFTLRCFLEYDRDWDGDGWHEQVGGKIERILRREGAKP